MSKNKWYEQVENQGDLAVSTRIRLARNLKDYPFSSKLTADKINCINRAVWDLSLIHISKGFSLPMVVGGIKHLAYDLGHSLLLDGSHIVAVIEELHIEARRLCAPQS